MTNSDLVEMVRAEYESLIPNWWEPLVLGLLFVLGMVIGNLVLDTVVFSTRDMIISYSSYLFGSYYMRRMWMKRTCRK